MNNMRDVLCRVLNNYEIARDIFYLTLQLPDEFTEDCKPGQFAEIKLPHHNEHVLRRPISINSFNKTYNTVTFAYQVVGAGTAILTQLKEQDELMVLLPLGNGFASRSAAKILMIGAGIGAAPLKYYAEVNSENEITAVLGYRNVEKIYQEQDFVRLCKNVEICTDDGSNGKKSYAATLAKEIASKNNFDYIVACGPNIVLKQVAEFANEMNIPCELSLEARMGCGIGACMGCNVTVKDENGNHIYKRCCSDGPVFDSKEVVFDE